MNVTFSSEDIRAFEVSLPVFAFLPRENDHNN